MMTTGPDGGGWDRVRCMPPIAVLRVGQDLPDPSRGNQRSVVRRAFRLGPGATVLVRLDGIVAWRHDGPYVDPAAAASTAVATALGYHRSSAADRA
jgi:hypothetical protein